jgi:HlyD family secretion protein
MAPPVETSLDKIIEDARPSFIRRHRLWLILAVVVALAVVMALVARLGDGKGPTYLTEQARRGALVATVTATGTLEPVVEVEVGTEVSGIIASVSVKENDIVKAGQELARLDTTRLEAQVSSSRANLRMAQAQVADAKAALRQAVNDLERIKTLVAGGWRSPAELDAAEAAHDRAAANLALSEARVSEAQASLASNEDNLNKAIIRAPIDGVVLTRLVDPGQTVAASFQTPVLFTIAGDLKRMQVKANIDEADIGQVRTDNPAAFTVDAHPGRRFSASVVSLRYAPTITDTSVVTYEAVLEVDNDELLLRPGMTATVDIVVTELQDRLLVPNAALRFAPPPGEQDESAPAVSGPAVWVLKDGKPVRVGITPGASDGRWTEVVSGDIAPGTAVIVDQLAAGAKPITARQQMRMSQRMMR